MVRCPRAQAWVVVLVLCHGAQDWLVAAQEPMPAPETVAPTPNSPNPTPSDPSGSPTISGAGPGAHVSPYPSPRIPERGFADADAAATPLGSRAANFRWGVPVVGCSAQGSRRRT